MYFEIAQSGEVEKIIREGFADRDQCAEEWEKIVQKNGEVNSDYSYKMHLNASKSQLNYGIDYMLIRLLLYRLCLETPVSVDLVEEVRAKGYPINTNSQQEFNDSIANAFRKSENLVTKAKMKANEMKGRQSESKPIDIGTALARVSEGIGFRITPDITLSEFNEYKKILKEKQRAKKNGRVHTR